MRFRRPTTPRHRGGRLAIVGVVALLVTSVLAALAVTQGAGAHTATAPTPHRGAAVGPQRGSAPAASTAVALKDSRNVVVGASRHLPTDATKATTADGLLPTPVHPPTGWAVTVHHVASEGLDRYYLVARPATSGAPAPTSSEHMPVLVVLHGRMMTPAAMMGMSHFLTEVGRAIVVYPSGYDESWNAGYCCGGASQAGVNDVAFLSAVVHEVLAQQPGAQAGQVYLAGYSNGGRMAYRMACDVPGMFAGVAAVEAISVSSCASTDPVPLLIVASQDDPVLTIGANAPPKHIEGRAEITVDAEVNTWRALEGCRPVDTAAAFGDLRTQTWSECAGDGRVEAAIYGGGSHAWYKACRSTPSAQALVWSFFHNVAPPVSAAPAPACPLHLSQGRGHTGGPPGAH